MIRFLMPLTIILLIIGCGDNEQNPPIIFSINADPKIVLPGESANITVEAGDSDKDKLSYLWVASAGSVEGTGKSVVWKSPQNEGKYELTVTVSDGASSVSETTFIRVWTPRPGDYYPLAIENKWTYKDKQDSIIDFEIVDTIDISGTQAFVKMTTTSNIENAVNYSYVAKGSDVINQHAVGGSSAGDDTIIFSPVLPLYKFPLIPGESWEVEFSVSVPGGYYVGNGKAKYEVVSEESVTVKGGTFNHVFQVKEDFVWEIFGQELDRTISRQWLAPNVGIVKFVNEQTRGGETFSTEAELQSYSLK
jgi:hypothetical protein